MNRTSPRLDVIPGLGIIAGGALAVVGCLLPWEKLSPGQSGLFDPRTRNALEEPFDLGALALGAGIALVVAGMVYLSMKAPTVRRLTAEVATVIALVPVLVAGYNIATMDRKIDEVFRAALEEATGQRLTEETVDLARAELERLGIEVSLQPGIYLALVGGLIGLVGSLMALRPRKGQTVGDGTGVPATMPPPTSPPKSPDVWGSSEPGDLGAENSEEDPPT